MRQKYIISALLLLYVELLPYLCRLPRGVAWATQYLPDDGMLIFSLLFFGAFAAAAVFPLWLGYWLKNRFPWAYRASIFFVTLMLIYFHKDYDLASDAQAAIGLIFIPIYTAMLGSLVWALVAGSEWISKRSH